jgi:hypothetical protein
MSAEMTAASDCISKNDAGRACTHLQNAQAAFEQSGHSTPEERAEIQRTLDELKTHAGC